MLHSRFLFSLLLLGGVLLLGAPAQEAADDPPSSDEPLNVDDLFESEDDRDEDESPQTGEEPDAGAGDADQGTADSEPGDPEPAGTLLDRVQERDPIDLAARSRMTLGYSPGWTEPLGTEGAYEGLSLLQLSSSLTLNLTISKVFEVTQAFSFAYPSYDFRVTKLAVDYTVRDAVFLTLGRTRLNWGRSPNFAYTNLLQRQAENPVSAPNPTGDLVARVSVPIGIGGLELIVQNKDAYQEDPGSPSPERFGYGGKFNLARERLDLDVGAFYQRGLSGRAFVSGQTTVFDWLEVYGEALVADSRLRADPTGPYADVEERTTESGEPLEPEEVEIAPDRVIADNNPDYAANLGVVIGLFDNSLDLNAEYYYNGEETGLEVGGARFPLFWGHNLAANADWSIPGTPLRLRLAYRYNHNFRSTFLAPRLTVDAFRHTTVDIAGGLLWGPEDAGYRPNNPDPADRPTFFAVSVTLNGSL